MSRNWRFVWVTLAWVGVVQVCHAHESKNLLPKKQHKDSDAPFLKPEEAVAKMAIPDGFDVSVFASEPDIAEPIAFCFDERGRMWVAENFNYQTRRQHTDAPVSRIQILEDTDGDGVFDKKKTFSDSLTFTSGLACGFGGVFVGSPPNLSFIPDRDGDDTPDGPPEVLLDGWGIRDRHETLNSFIWGPDGWLYGCHGVFTHSSVGKPGDAPEQRQFIDGGIWRYHPTRKTFEIFARGLSNPWGFDFNDHGQGFITCCVIPHLFHIVQGGVYHKQSRPHVNPYIYDDIKTIRTHKARLSAHGGARFYLADVFPEKYRDRLFMCNIHEHAVLTDVLERNGSSFLGHHGDDFLPTNDLAWVGFSVEIGPEGGVYVLDWHDQDICGNDVKFPNSGRVYRIMPEGIEAKPRMNLGKMSDGELVELQEHSNDWYVRQARTLLQYRASTRELEKEAVHVRLNEMFAAAPNAAKRLRAMWALRVTDGLGRSRLVELLDDQNEYVRAWSIQFLTDSSDVNAFQPREQSASEIGVEVLDRFTLMAKKDSSPVVRLYLASAVQRLPFDQRWPILEGLINHPEDATDNNLPRMYWFALEPMVPLHQRRSLELAVGGKIPRLQEFVARRLTSGGGESIKVSKVEQAAEWERIIQSVASGMQITAVGDGGVVHHPVFRNEVAVQTHPVDPGTPCVIKTTYLNVPKQKKTALKLRVSHHPHGDWQLRVLANDKVLTDQIVGPTTVAADEWMDLSVDLSDFAGQRIDLSIENRANNGKNNWAYWNKVQVVSEQSNE
ncbi:MAG: PVC-type heme-binding CxxCH protein [Planctomycetota bacterium]